MPHLESPHFETYFSGVELNLAMVNIFFRFGSEEGQTCALVVNVPDPTQYLKIFFSFLKYINMFGIVDYHKRN